MIRIGVAANLVVLVGLLPPTMEPVRAAVPYPADDPTHVSLSDVRPQT